MKEPKKINWLNNELGNITDILDNKRKPVTKSDRTSGEYPYYGATGTLDYVNDYIFDEKLVLVGEDGAKWRSGEDTAFIVTGRCWVNNHAHVLRPNRKIVIDEWLVHYLNFCDLSDYVKGVTVPKLNQANLRKIIIPLPNIEEQKRIVSILDNAFTEVGRVKEIAEVNCKNSQDLFESTLSYYLTDQGTDWEYRTLKDISLVFGRGRSRHRPRNDKNLYGGKYPFIQTGDIRNSKQLITKHTQTYNECGLAQSKLWPKGTICITIAANIAETGILGFDACFPDSIIGLIIDPKKAIPEYIEYTLQSYKKRLQAKGKGSAQDNLNMEKFENEFFPIPPLKTQQQILSELNAIASETQRLTALYVKKVAHAMDFRKSVLNKAFRGEL